MKSYAEVFIIGLKYLKIKMELDVDRFLSVICISIIAVCIICELIRSNDLDNNAEYTLGVIREITWGGKCSEAYLCEFYVNGEKYLTTEGKGLSKIVVGDSALIKYDRNNPYNSEIVIYFEYTLDRSKLPDTVFYRRPMSRMRKPLE